MQDSNFETEVNNWKLNAYQRMTLRIFSQYLKDDPKLFNTPQEHRIKKKCSFKPEPPEKSIHLRAKLDLPHLINKPDKSTLGKNEKPPISSYPRTRPEQLLPKRLIKGEDLKLHLQNKLGELATTVGQSRTAPNLQRPPAVPRRNDPKLSLQHTKDENYKDLDVPNLLTFKNNRIINGSFNYLANISNENAPRQANQDLEKKEIHLSSATPAKPQFPPKSSELRKREISSLSKTPEEEPLNEIDSRPVSRDSDCSYITDNDIAPPRDNRLKPPLPDSIKRISSAKQVLPPIVPDFNKVVKATSLSELRVSKKFRKLSDENESHSPSSVSQISPVAVRRPQILPGETEDYIDSTDNEEGDHEYEDPRAISKRYLVSLFFLFKNIMKCELK